MQKHFRKMFPVFEIIAFNPLDGISLIYNENTCDQQSTCYQTVGKLWT